MPVDSSSHPGFNYQHPVYLRARDEAFAVFRRPLPTVHAMAGPRGNPDPPPGAAGSAGRLVGPAESLAIVDCSTTVTGAPKPVAS